MYRGLDIIKSYYLTLLLWRWSYGLGINYFSSWSILLGKMKSFSNKPLMAWVYKVTSALPQPKFISGWCPSISAIPPTLLTNSRASLKFLNLNFLRNFKRLACPSEAFLTLVAPACWLVNKYAVTSLPPQIKIKKELVALKELSFSKFHG